jgi:hypothetical protein
MTEAVVIDKNRELLPAQDYALLRSRGLEYIQELCGALWTDHNASDPGITILEALCYALTDLGYRTSFDIKDLLASGGLAADDPALTGLFPAHEVLTTAPLTVLDYRKLLLKIEGVRNAWLDPMRETRESEVPLYADCAAGSLSYDETNSLGNSNPRVHLNGLYRVLLELEIDDRLGSLNETRLTYQVRRGPLKGVILALDSQDAGFGLLDFSPQFAGVSQVEPVTQAGTVFTAEVELAVDDGNGSPQPLTLPGLRLRVVNDRPRPNADPVPVTPADLEAVLGEALPDSLMPLFWEKQQVRQAALERVRCVLDAHRNLCEDFLSIATVAAQPIAICADIEVRSDADIEDVQARVFHVIDQYFNPPVVYHKLKELLDAGVCADEIFDGPYVNPAFQCRGLNVFTKPGFVLSEELAATSLRSAVYVSDIINLLMDFPEIVSVKNVLLRQYGADGSPVGEGQKWSLAIEPGRQPILAIEQSKVLFFKSEIPYRARSTEFQKTLDHLRAMARKAAYVAPNQVLPFPGGTDRDTGAFFSVQHDLPLTYGVGKAGLALQAPPEREAQARQLKTYLTFYDQVLADYLAQLAGVQRLFSLDTTLRQTYFSQYLTGIAPVRTQFEDEFYVDKAELQALLAGARLIEDEELYQDRRNRILDHLMARFAEQFTDYVLMMFDLQGDPLKTGEGLIEDKIDFLREYPVVSRERGRGSNIGPEDPAEIWDTENVAGLQKRVSRLLGISDYSRRDLACPEVLASLFSIAEDAAKFRVAVLAAGESSCSAPRRPSLRPSRPSRPRSAYTRSSAARPRTRSTPAAGRGRSSSR